MTRQKTPPWSWASAGALLGLLLATLIFAPARWLTEPVQAALDGRVVFDDAQGTIWNGSARLGLAGGAGSSDASSLPGRLVWMLSPHWSGLRAEIQADCCMQQAWHLTVQPRWAGAELALADSLSQWPAQWLTGLGTPWNTVQADGQLTLLTQGLTLHWAAGRLLMGGRVQLDATLNTLSPQLKALQLDVVPAVLGADLLGRRPDVVASRWRVEAASQDVVVARTQFYPNVNLSVFVGFNALGVGHLLNADSRQMGVSPAVRLPLFDGGRLQAQLSGRQAELDMAVSQYNFAVLEAVKESTDAISSDQSLMRQAESQTAALASAHKNHALAQQRFDAGLGNHLNVLSAETAVLLQSRASVDVKARQLDNRVNLMKALGGGWREETAALPAPVAATSESAPALPIESIL